MDPLRPLRDWLQDRYRDLWLELEDESRNFLDPLQEWVNNLLQRRMPSDWRAQLRDFLALWEAEGFRLVGHSTSSLEKWIDDWARFRRLLPLTTDVFPVTATGTTAVNPQPLAVRIGPPADPTEIKKRAIAVPSGRAPSASKKEDVELAGDGPETSDSFRSKVQVSLEVLDPEVGEWWKRPSVMGVVRSYDATSWARGRFLYFNHYGILQDGRIYVVVDRNYTPGQAAQAVIYEARSGLFAHTVGARFRLNKVARSQDWKAFQAWQRESLQRAAEYSSVLAELYVASLASITASGTLVVTINDVAENGLSWQQLLLVLPLMARLSGRVKTILLRGRNFALKLSKSQAGKLSKLPDGGEKLLANATAAKSEKEAQAIIERGLATTASELTGQVHHVISQAIYNELSKHRILRGVYQYRDPRFTSRAITKEAHNGYQKWHRKLDAEVVDWLKREQRATPKEFEAWLRWRYRQKDVLERFPEGF
jgi:hypothetical protein